MKSSSLLRAFTLIELLTVIAIIAVLMALILGVGGMVQTKASRDRASAEIAALSTAMESYKADNGIYPQVEDTDKLVASSAAKSNIAGSPTAKSSLALYVALSGDDADPASPDFRRTGDEKQNPVYFEFETKKNMVSLSSGNKVQGLLDPWGDFYGYSTAYAKEIQDGVNPPTKGYNPTFDLWSFANSTDGKQEKWVKNW